MYRGNNSTFPYATFKISVRILSYSRSICWMWLKKKTESLILTTNKKFLHSISIKVISIHQEIITFHFLFLILLMVNTYRAVEMYNNQRLVHGWINSIHLFHQCSVLKSPLAHLAWLFKTLRWISGINNFKYSMGEVRIFFYPSLIWHKN